MPNETTDFFEPPKPGTEYVGVDPLNPDEPKRAVYCCKCQDEGFCASEQTVSGLARAYGQSLAFWGESWGWPDA